MCTHSHTGNVVVFVLIAFFSIIIMFLCVFREIKKQSEKINRRLFFRTKTASNVLVVLNTGHTQTQMCSQFNLKYMFWWRFSTLFTMSGRRAVNHVCIMLRTKNHANRPKMCLDLELTLYHYIIGLHSPWICHNPPNTVFFFPSHLSISVLVFSATLRKYV